MEIRLLTSPDDFRTYDGWVRSHPEGSLWQSLEWKQFQEALGRAVRIYVTEEDGTIAASALVVIDRTSFGLSTWEIPRGPLWVTDYGSRITDFLEKIVADAKKTTIVSVLFSPAQIFRNPPFRPRGPSGPCGKFAIRYSHRFVMPEATRIVDLTLAEDDLLAQMKPKGRYNIRLAEKHGVTVAISRDVDAYAALAEETARRDGFRGHTQTFYNHFLQDVPGSFLLLAHLPENAKKTPSEGRQDSLGSLPEARPIAGLLGVMWGTTGIYYYGASGNQNRDVMAPYALQWEAMRHCKTHGCISYDLFGIAPGTETPSAETPQSPRGDHPWSGVSDFKAKFGGRVVHEPPEQEIVLRPGVKMLLGLKRKLF